MSTAPQPGLAPGFLLSGGVRVRITIEVRSRRLVIDWSRVEPEDEPQPRGVFTSTERSYDDEPAELRVGFRGA